LALRLATARLRNRPRWTIRYLVDRLRDETRRLDELSSGERGVATTLRLSYQALDDQCRRALRLLSAHPGETIDLHAAAAILALDMRSAEEILEALLDVHLLEQPTMGTYAFHDLVRAFAAGLTTGEGGDEGGFERLLEYFLSASEAACTVLFPGRARRPTGIAETPAQLPEFGTAAAAEAWLVREQAALLSAVVSAHRRGYDRHAAFLARNLGFWLNSLGMLTEFAEVSRLAVAAARRTEDPGLLGTSLSNLGVACWKLGHFDEGIEVARQAHDVAVGLGDAPTEAHSNGVLGLYYSLLGRFPEARAHLEAAIAQGRAIGAGRAVAESLTALSTVYEQEGRYEAAADAARAALDLGRQLAQREIVLVAVNDLAMAYVGMGKLTDAEACLAEGRELCNGSNEPGHEALTMAMSADVAIELGQPDLTAGYTAKALGLVDFTASPLRRAKVHNVLARVYAKQGETVRALTGFAKAHQIAASISYRVEEAYALLGLGQAYEALGDEAAASRNLAAAEELFASMDVPAPLRRR
jgi:tetratricopeptide (TPR) repeat protein